MILSRQLTSYGHLTQWQSNHTTLCPAREALTFLQTIAPTARYLDGELEYNKHSLYGLSTVIATTNALNSMISKRPFILTRFVSQQALDFYLHFPVAFSLSAAVWCPLGLLTMDVS